MINESTGIMEIQIGQKIFQIRTREGDEFYWKGKLSKEFELWENKDSCWILSY
jgi:hypothetical protein